MITPQHDDYYRTSAPAYTDPQRGDCVLVMRDAFRGPDGEFACADVVTIGDEQVEVEQPHHLGAGGRAWVALTEVALIASEKDESSTEMTGPDHVTLDPERLADCVDLAHALSDELGVQVDPAAVREVLRKLARTQPVTDPSH